MLKKPLDEGLPAQAHPAEATVAEPAGPDVPLRQTDALLRRVDELRRARRPAEALHLLGDAPVGLSEPSADLAVAHGRVLLALHRPDDAVAVLRQAYKLHGDYADLAAWLIASLSRGRHYDEATALAAEVCERFPSSALVRVATGRLLIDRYRLEESLPHFREAYALDPGDPRGLTWLLHGLRLARRFDEVDALAATTGLTADTARIAYASSLLDRYQFERVLIELEAVTDEDVEIRALQVRLETLRDLHRLDDAQRLAEEAAVRRPGDARPWVELGYVLNDRYRFEDALAAFEQALAIDSYDADALEWRTTALRYLHRLDEAERTARKAVTRRPDEPRVYVELSYVHDDQRDYERALAACEQALGIDPDNAGALAWRTAVLRHLHRPDQARSAANEAIARRPDVLRLHLEFAYVLAAQYEHEQSLAACERALSIDPLHARALLWRVGQLRGLRRFEEAEQAVREAIGQRPDSASLRVELGRLFNDLHDHEQALDSFEQAHAVDEGDEDALTGRIEQLRKLGRLDEAEGAAREAIERRPDDIGVRIQLAHVFHNRYEYKRALGVIEQVLAFAPDDEWVLTWQILQLQNLHRTQEAERVAREAVIRRPDSPELHIMLACALEDHEDLEGALESLERALAIEPTNEWVQTTWIRLLRRLRRFDEAEAAARNAINRLPNSPELYLELGYAHNARYEYQHALAASEQALTVDPRHEWALAWRITELRQLRRLNDAETAAREAIEKRPDSPQLHLELGYVYDDRYDYQRALETFEQALAIDPKHEWALTWRITELRQLRRLNDAETAAREAIEKRPDSPQLHLELGDVLNARHDYRHALAAFEQALAIDPGHESALVGRIRAIRQSGDLDEAESAARQAIEKHPHRAQLHLELGYVHDDQHDYQRALEIFEAALAIDPKHGWGLAWHITELRQLRRLGEAEEAAHRAIDRRPDSPALRLELASVAEDKADYPAALAAVQEALALDPANESALTARIRALRLSRDFANALAAAQEAVDARPDSVDVLVELGQVHADRYDDQRALTLFDRALALDPGYVQVVERRVAVLQRLQRHLDAERCARAAVTLRPTAESLHISLGRVFEDRLQVREALACYEDAVRCNPHDPRALASRSAALRVLRSYAEAERVIAPLVREQPHLRALAVELAWIQHDSGRLPEARATFARLERQALSDEERAESIAGLGWVDFACGDYVAAEERFGRAVELVPHDREYRLARAWALVRQDERAQWERAEQLCLGVLGERQDAAVLVCLGVIDYRLGRLPAAEYHLAKALEVDPYKGSHTDLAALYTQLGRYDEAEAHLRVTIAQDPYNASAQVELGHLRLLTDEPQEAARHFRGVLRVDPSMQVAALGLAEGLTALGQSREAEDVLREGLRTAAVPWRLHLALARLLFHQADATQNDDVFAEAYAEAIEAIKGAPAGEPDPHYVAAVCKVRLGGAATAGALGDARSRRQALRHLRRCLSVDEGHVDAQRVVQLLDRESRTARTAALGTATVATVALGLLTVMWTAFFLSDRVTVVMITTITPILVGLVAVAVLLPSLVRLKLPGFEADLQAGLGQITSGPTGEVVIRPGNLAISAGPVGYALSHRRSEDRQRR